MPAGSFLENELPCAAWARGIFRPAFVDLSGEKSEKEGADLLFLPRFLCAKAPPEFAEEDIAFFAPFELSDREFCP